MYRVEVLVIFEHTLVEIELSTLLADWVSPTFL